MTWNDRHTERFTNPLDAFIALPCEETSEHSRRSEMADCSQNTPVTPSRSGYITPPATTGVVSRDVAVDVAAAAAALSVEATAASGTSSSSTVVQGGAPPVPAADAAEAPKAAKVKKKKKKKKKSSYKSMMASMMKSSRTPEQRKAESKAAIAGALGGGQFQKFEKL